MVHPQIDISAANLSPHMTMDSGQVFRWKRIDDSVDEWVGVAEGNLLKVSRSYATLLGNVRSSTNFSELIEQYFSTCDDLEQTFSSFPKDDPFLSSALSKFSGLRLLTQRSLGVSYLVRVFN